MHFINQNYEKHALSNWILLSSRLHGSCLFACSSFTWKHRTTERHLFPPALCWTGLEFLPLQPGCYVWDRCGGAGEWQHRPPPDVTVALADLFKCRYWSVLLGRERLHAWISQVFCPFETSASGCCFWMNWDFYLLILTKSHFCFQRQNEQHFMHMRIGKHNAAEHNLQRNVAVATSVCQVERWDVHSPWVFKNLFFTFP